METANTKPGRVCPYTIAFILDNWLRKRFQNPAKILGGYIRPGDTVMDMGCGPGFFTLEMAKLVGTGGRVIAVDLQTQMLARVAKKAARKGVTERITCHQCRSGRIGLNEKADFILAYYMVHETPDPAAFLKEARTLLKKDGRLLVVEPSWHVSRATFETMLETAGAAGLAVIGFPRKKGGHGVLFGQGCEEPSDF